jgi:hypothetical protein
MFPCVTETTRSSGLESSPGPPFNPDLQVWVEDGVRAGLPDAAFWGECRRGVESIALPCVAQSRREELADTILLAVMQSVACATAVERFDDWEFLASVDSGRAQCQEAIPADARRLADFAAALSNEYNDRLQQLPRHAEFAEILDYDSQRLVNTLRNAHGLPAGKTFLRRVQSDAKFAAGLHVLVSAMIDVMGSPGFDSGEIGLLREALRTADYRFREESLFSEWERGTGAGIPGDDAAAGRWQRCRRELLLMQPKIKSVDLGAFVTGLETLAGLQKGGQERFGC